MLLQLFFLLSLSANADASCYQKLMGDNVDSNSIKVYADLDPEISEEAGARILLNRAFKNVGCEAAALIQGGITCRELVAGKSHTNVCYYEDPNLGYFFIAKDYVDTAYVVFNRWD